MMQFFQHNRAAIADASSSMHRRLLLAIIITGFLLRLYSLVVGHGYHYYALRDEVLALDYALAFLAGEPHALYLGQPLFSGGQVPGPLWALLVAILYKLGGNTVDGAMFCMLLLNTLVIYLVYRFATKFMSAAYALLTCLFYALAPWAIYYSAGIWNPMPLALLGLLLFFPLWQVTQQHHSRSIFWVLLLAAAIPQFHVIGIFYYPAILLILFMSPTRLNWKWLLLGIAASSLLYLPYLVGELFNNWENTRKYFSEDTDFTFGVLKIISIPISVLSNQPGIWAGYHFSEFMDFGNRWFGSYILLLLLNVISIFPATVFLFSFVKKALQQLRQSSFNPRRFFRDQPGPAFLANLIILPILFFMLSGHNYSSRYAIIIYPLLFMLPALFSSRIKTTKFTALVAGCWGFSQLVNIYLVMTFYSYQHTLITDSDMFRPSFRVLQEVHQTLRAHAGNNVHIKLDTRSYIADDRYTPIIGTGIEAYMNTVGNYVDRTRDKADSITYYLGSANDAAIAKANIVYSKNGLIIYTR